MLSLFERYVVQFSDESFLYSYEEHPGIRVCESPEHAKLFTNPSHAKYIAHLFQASLITVLVSGDTVRVCARHKAQPPMRAEENSAAMDALAKEISQYPGVQTVNSMGLVRSEMIHRVSTNFAGRTCNALAMAMTVRMPQFDSPRSTTPIKFRWTPASSASFSWLSLRLRRIFRTCLPNTSKAGWRMNAR